MQSLITVLCFFFCVVGLPRRHVAGPHPALCCAERSRHAAIQILLKRDTRERERARFKSSRELLHISFACFSRALLAQSLPLYVCWDVNLIHCLKTWHRSLGALERIHSICVGNSLTAKRNEERSETAAAAEACVQFRSLFVKTIYIRSIYTQQALQCIICS